VILKGIATMANQTTDRAYVSLIIPVYNEESRIGKSLERIMSFFDSEPYVSEVVIVDDGSTDRTVELIREGYGNHRGVRIYQQARNLGKGEAVKQGMLLGSGEYLFFSDADLSVPIETLSLFLSYLEKGFPVAIGSRQKPDSVIEIHQPAYREIMGKIYTKLTNLILGLQLSDFTCGFKGFTMGAAKEIFVLQRVQNWSFDAEILYLARLKGYGIMEIPVRWRNDQATKVRLWRDIIASFFGLIEIRANRWAGRYG
jgi:dolichyl-phosphate beta-glucosyltransferase